MGLFWLGTAVLFASLPPSSRNLAAGVVAVGLSILSNFLLNDLWTWSDRRTPGPRAFLTRLLKYSLVASIAGAVQLAVMWVLSIPLALNQHVVDLLNASTLPLQAVIDLNPGDHLANFIGIASGVAINFLVNNLWTFRQRDDDAPETTPDTAEGAASAPTASATPPQPLKLTHTSPHRSAHERA